MNEHTSQIPQQGDQAPSAKRFIMPAVVLGFLGAHMLSSLSRSRWRSATGRSRSCPTTTRRRWTGTSKTSPRRQLGAGLVGSGPTVPRGLAER